MENLEASKLEAMSETKQFKPYFWEPAPESLLHNLRCFWCTSPLDEKATRSSTQKITGRVPSVLGSKLLGGASGGGRALEFPCLTGWHAPVSWPRAVLRRLNRKKHRPVATATKTTATAEPVAAAIIVPISVSDELSSDSVESISPAQEMNFLRQTCRYEAYFELEHV